MFGLQLRDFKSSLKEAFSSFLCIEIDKSIFLTYTQTQPYYISTRIFSDNRLRSIFYFNLSFYHQLFSL